MSYQRERDEFIAAMTREGLPLHVTLTLLREATGFQRRAELACSSEAADRDRVPCPAMPRIDNKGEIHETGGVCLCDSSCADCGKGYAHIPRHSADAFCSACGSDWKPKHSTIPRITLQDWRAEYRLRALLASEAPGWTMQTAGDPRGYTLRVIPPSYAERNTGRDVYNMDSIGVPSGPTRLHF